MSIRAYSCEYVLRPVSSNTATFDQNSVLATTLEVREQPEKRMSEVQVYFGKTDYLAPDDQENVYNRMARVSDPSAVVEYGSASIKKILSRWIDINGRASAETLANKQLVRYRDPPRAVRFDLMRDQVVDPQLGAGYLLGGTPFQDITGASSSDPNSDHPPHPVADHFEVEAEEMLWIPFGDLPSERGVTLTSKYQVNLRDEHDLLYPLDSYLPIASGDIVNCILPSNVVIGSLHLRPGARCRKLASRRDRQSHCHRPNPLGAAGKVAAAAIPTALAAPMAGTARPAGRRFTPALPLT